MDIVGSRVAARACCTGSRWKIDCSENNQNYPIKTKTMLPILIGALSDGATLNHFRLFMPDLTRLWSGSLMVSISPDFPFVVDHSAMFLHRAKNLIDMFLLRFAV